MDSHNLERKLRLDAGRYLFMLFSLSVGFINHGKTRADLKCEGKESSESDKLTINAISVTIDVTTVSFSQS